MSSAVSIVVELRPKDGTDMDKLAGIVRELVAESNAEVGCVYYTYLQKAETPSTFLFVEKWSDCAAVDSHENSPHFKKLVPELVNLVDIVYLKKFNYNENHIELEKTPLISDLHVSSTVRLVVTVEVSEESKFKTCAQKLVVESNKEDGCLEYNFCKSQSNPNEYIFIELWKDQHALDVHSSSSHCKSLIPELDSCSKVTSVVKGHYFNNASEYITPTSVNFASILPQSTVESWRREGYALVDDLLPIELLQAVKNDALSVCPEWDMKKNPENPPITDFGGSGLNFPSTFDSINRIALHPTIQNIVSNLLLSSPMDIRLTQCEAWPKYGYRSTNPDSNSDQRIHCDYPNHTLVHPPTWDEPEAVEMIIYLNAVEECDGATAVVPRVDSNDELYSFPISNLPGFGTIPWINNKTKAEEYIKSAKPDMHAFRQKLYAREKLVKYKFGTVLFYRHDTWHRGKNSPIYSQSTY